MSRRSDSPGSEHSDRRRTSRRRSDALLDDRLQLVLESITDRFFAIDRDWRYTHFNQHAKQQLRALGRDPDALLGSVLWEQFPNPTLEPQLRQAMRDRTIAMHTDFFPDLNEWIESRIYPTLDGGLAIFQSYLTEKKVAEEKLRRSEAYLAEGQRLTHTGSWAWNVKTGVLYWSEEHFRICGLDPASDRPSSSAMGWIHPDDRRAVEEAFDASIRNRRDFELDYRVVRRDGTVRHVHSFAHPVFDPAGRLTEYVGTTLDITERKQSEDARNDLVRRLIAAQEEERRRISRELHDDFGQQLTALKLKLAALHAQYRSDASLASQLASLEAIVRQMDADTDLIAWQLRPAALDDHGLPAAVANYVEGWSSHFDITVQVHVGGEPNHLTSEAEIALYRIMQEALNNVAKHAGARHASVVLQQNPDQTILTVEDDGVGFVPESLGDRDKRLGLAGMRERATLLGGTLDIESTTERGTTVIARIPARPQTHVAA